MSESWFGQRASGLVFTTTECASTSSVNSRVVRSQCASEHGMCEWFGHNVGVNMERASTMMCK